MSGDYPLAQWIPSSNFWAGGDGNQLIVVHATASGGPQTGYQLATSTEFTDGKSASVHYINDTDGKVYQIVRENDSAWGNCCATGNSQFDHVYNWNKKSISIENVKHSSDNSEPLTLVQYKSLLFLIRDIAKRQNIPLRPGGNTQSGIIFHHDLDPINKGRCPGTFPYATFIQDLQGVTPVATQKKWYEYPWGVHFGTGDVGFNGAHDATILAPPNYEVTFPLSGSIVDLSAPSWGKQVGIHLDNPYKGIPFFAFLHLSALNPALTPGKHVNKGDIAGWVGGATKMEQYNGTSNPTGSNFLNDPVMSSQIQVGFALSRGPVYGTGAGWSTNPDPALNPEQIIADLRSNAAMINQNQRTAFEKEWRGVLPDVSLTSGIANAAWSDYQAFKFHGPALSHEYQTFTWSGTTVIVQLTAGGRYEWDGSAHFYSYS